MSHPTTRFTHTVANYVKARPHYPQEIIHILKEKCNLNHDSIIADIGAGTGIFTELFLQNGNPIFTIEPNDKMREAAEHTLHQYPFLICAAGSAEATMLPPKSIDFITAATAFHWFDLEKARAEFKRILKPKGWVVLVWNVRAQDESPLMSAYEELITHYGNDYVQVAARHNINDEVLAGFFAPAVMQTFSIPNYQNLDLENFIARALSSSYAPKPDDKNYNKFIKELAKLFNLHQKEGAIKFIYECKGNFAQM